MRVAEAGIRLPTSNCALGSGNGTLSPLSLGGKGLPTRRASGRSGLLDAGGFRTGGAGRRGFPEGESLPTVSAPQLQLLLNKLLECARFLSPPTNHHTEPAMTEQPVNKKDQIADAIAAVAVITIAVLAAVLWVSGQG